MSLTALEIQTAMDTRDRLSVRVWFLVFLGVFLCCCTAYGVSFYYFFSTNDIEIRTGKIYTVNYKRGRGSYQFGFLIKCITDSNDLCPQSNSELTRVKGRKFNGIFSPVFIVLSIEENGRRFYSTNQSMLIYQLLRYTIGWLFFSFVPFAFMSLVFMGMKKPSGAH